MRSRARPLSYNTVDAALPRLARPMTGRPATASRPWRRPAERNGVAAGGDRAQQAHVDLAVHPAGKLEKPRLRPELKIGVEWRFAYFNFANAQSLVTAAIQRVWDLLDSAKPTNDRVAEYSKSLRERLRDRSPFWNKQANTTPTTLDLTRR